MLSAAEWLTQRPDTEGRANEAEELKQEQLKKQKDGKGHWEEGLASDSESIVRIPKKYQQNKTNNFHRSRPIGAKPTRRPRTRSKSSRRRPLRLRVRNREHSAELNRNSESIPVGRGSTLPNVYDQLGRS